MSLLWLDGFDQYSTTNNADISARLSSAGYQGGSVLSVQASSTTRTGVGMSLARGQLSGFNKAFPGQASVITGFAYMHDGNAYLPICQFRYNDFLGSEWDMVVLNVGQNGAITAVIMDKNGAGYTSYHSDENVLYPNVWNYIEGLYTPAANGTLIVKVDGLAVITASSVATKHPALPNMVNVFRFNSPNTGGGTHWIDDWYLLANDGVGLSAFQGDVVVHAVLLNGDAGPNDMSQFGGSVGHFTTLIDINAPDENTYVYTSAADKEELFTLADLPVDIIDVLAVQLAVRARKDSAGLSSYKMLAVSGTDSFESDPLTTTTQYLTKQVHMETAPGGGAWTLSKAQNLQIGFKTV